MKNNSLFINMIEFNSIIIMHLTGRKGKPFIFNMMQVPRAKKPAC